MDISKLSKIILDYGNKKDFISDVEILSFAKECYPNFNPSFKNILISKLMEDRVIYSYDLNIYKVYHDRKEFVNYESETIEKQLIKYISDKQLKVSYFDSSIFNSLSSLQSIKSYIFVGVESYAVNYLIDKMEKNSKKTITTNDLAKLRKLFSGVHFDFDYVIKTINVDTPLFKKRSDYFYYPKLETLLVDLFADKTLYNLYSSEIENIYINAFREYAIKINTIFRYAEKKGVKEKIMSLLDYISFDIKRGEFNYD